MTARLPLLVAALAMVLGLAACAGPRDGDASSEPSTTSTPATAPAPSPTGESTPEVPLESQEPRESREPRPPRVRELPERQWQAMVEAGMVRPECPVQERSQLRRIDVEHHDFSGRVRQGHLVVHADTAASLRRIVAGMVEREFPFRRMEGVEAYDGDTEASLRANNTSVYNCRRPDQINAPFLESPHANGRAIDVNPVQNPWVDLRCDCWVPGVENSERTPGPGKVLQGDATWRAFTDEGWIWQNIDTPDYMHFDTGYPSTPYQRP